jgi:CO/xanthine dehydrogenase FAD-binding subunit
MIIEYHRPTTLEETFRLMNRKEIKTLPMAGGTVLNRPSAERFAVVDLQALGLDGLEQQGNSLFIGATVTLQKLLSYPGVPEPLQRAIRQEAGYNLRQVATVAGSLVAAGGRSPYATVLLALDAALEIRSGETAVESLALGDLLPLRAERLPGRLITRVSFSLNGHLAYEAVARTPADTPIVCAALVQWPSGRTRLALGGFGSAPVLALDGPEANGVEEAARDAYSRAGDEWASSAYRQDLAATLARRCLSTVESSKVEG